MLFRSFAPANIVCNGRRLPVIGDLPEFLVRTICEAPHTSTVPADVGHNELLGGHGSDTIHADPWGDVIWGDYKPSGQPTRQHDRIWGGRGRDHIYASHGKNAIRAGGGNDWIKAHFGFGLVNCGAGNDLLYISRRAQKHYKIRNCERISHKTLGR